jgi:hypothetical protein
MEPWMILVGLLALLIAVPAVLLGALGVVALVLKMIAIVQKAAEPPTVDQDGHYSLDQGQEIGRQE